MTLKATEVRIGNWVNFDFKVDGQEQIEFGWQIDEGYRFHGIPLTEEWLVRFGFEKEIIDQGNKEVDGYWKNVLMMIPCPNNKEYFYGAPYGYPMSGDKTMYVHQLQNLYFALTGEELTFN